MEQARMYSWLSQGMAWFGLFIVAHFCRMSFIVGSFHAGFSGISTLMPLSGALNNSIGMGLLFLLQLAWYGYKGLHLSTLAFFVPGVIASLYLYTESVWLSRVLPLICIGLFALHPVGYYALPYAFLWFIPLLLSYSQFHSVFTRALIGTFTAHAVGSIIWLYTVPLAASAWLALIPVVCLERLFFALSITIAYSLVCLLKAKIAPFALRTAPTA